MKKKQGFTLIELLAVIVILAVIALIATPLIMGTITKAKINSFKDSMYGVLKSAEQYVGEKLLESENSYPGEFINLTNQDKLNYKGSKINGEVMITKDGSVNIKAVYGDSCYYKNESDKEILSFKGNCDKLYTYNGVYGIPTDANEFETEVLDNGKISIKKYKGPTNTIVNIPETINGKLVVKIDSYAFRWMKLTKVRIPNSVERMEWGSFMGNNLNEIIFPKNEYTYSGANFISNNMPEEKAWIYHRTVDGLEDRKVLNSYAGADKKVNVPSQIEVLLSWSLTNREEVILNEGLKIMHDFSLSEHQFTEIRIPSTVTNIGTDVLRLSPTNDHFQKIINKTGRAFDWGLITGTTSTGAFVTGVVHHPNGDIQVVSE